MSHKMVYCCPHVGYNKCTVHLKDCDRDHFISSAQMTAWVDYEATKYRDIINRQSWCLRPYLSDNGEPFEEYNDDALFHQSNSDEDPPPVIELNDKQETVGILYKGQGMFSTTWGRGSILRILPLLLNTN